MNINKLLKIFSIVVVVFYATFIFIYLYLYLTNPRLVVSSDFVSFLTGASIIKSGAGVYIYNYATQLSHQLNVILPYFKSSLLPFRSPSAVAAFFIPFLELDLRVASLLFVVFNLVVLVIIVWLLVRGLAIKTSHKYFLVLVLALYFPNINAIVIGQFTLFLTLILVLVFLALSKQKYFFTGLAIGLLAIKPQYLLIAPFLFLLCKQKMDFIYGLALSVLIMFLVNIAVGGIRPIFDYIPFLLKTESVVFGSRPYHMFTFYGNLLVAPMINSLPKWLLLAINFVLYSLTLKVFALRLKKVPFEILFSVAILLTIFFSVHALVHDLTNFLIIIGVFLSYLFENKVPADKHKVQVIIVVLYLLPLIILLNNTVSAPLIVLILACYLLFSGFGKETKTKPERLKLEVVATGK